MRILCDAMLGDLARDLRFLGFDVAYAPELDDTTLLRKARAEGRSLLTRDRELAFRGGVLVEARDREEALDEVVRKLALKPADSALLSRCAECGARLEAAPPGSAPPFVKGPAWRCVDCGKLYWAGSHVERIRGRLARFKDTTDP